jgi:hypothetical protein
MGSSHTPQDRAGVAAPLILDLTSDADLTPAPDMIVFGYRRCRTGHLTGRDRHGDPRRQS